jgi:hypothetical protein
VILPVEFAVSDGGAHRIEGRLDMGVCLDICMPVTLDLTGDLLPDSERDRDHRPCAVGPAADGGGGRRRRGSLRGGADLGRVARDRHGDGSVHGQ